MKILLAHNYYRQAGGEDSVFASEMELLQQYGHSIIKYVAFNKDVKSLNVPRQMVWSQETYEKYAKSARDQKPEIAHFHNTFFAMSPSVYYACQDENIPVVQTLHNYRLLCPVALFIEMGKFVKNVWTSRSSPVLFTIVITILDCKLQLSQICSLFIDGWVHGRIKWILLLP